VPQFIRQLTGVRFVAAAWVVLYHLQLPLDQLHLMVPGVHDTIKVGRLGVDLFFALSGYILTHTYITKLGPALSRDGTLRFWWLRLARIYPVHFVMLNIAGLAAIAQQKVGQAPVGSRDWLNPVGWLKQALLVQEWGPNPQRGWNFPAWSLSMEWLAYLLFPLLILAVFWFRNRLSTGVLCLLWVVVLLPLLWYGAAYTSDPYYISGWGSTIRVLTEFTAGSLTYLIVARLSEGGVDGAPRVRVERLATTLSVLLPVLLVVCAVVLGHIGALQWPGSSTDDSLPPKYHLELVPLLVAWIGALALSRRGVSRWLATDLLVLGGYISYSLYLTHTVWYGLWRAGMKVVGINSGALYALGVVGLIAGALVIAWLMWRYVEEPAREWMRSRVGVRAVAVAEPAREPG
jgi:peptidoglycan/LPS O-acetylase OafA/YrhL